MDYVKKIRDFYEAISVDDLSRLNEIYEDDAFFKDPFNELKSIQNIRKIFVEMFKELDKPHFKFIDEIADNGQVFLTWDFIFTKNNKQYSIHGSSHLRLSPSGKISYHRDYWDVGEELLLKVPLIKSIYNILRKKLSVNS